MERRNGRRRENLTGDSGGGGRWIEVIVYSKGFADQFVIGPSPPLVMHGKTPIFSFFFFFFFVAPCKFPFSGRDSLPLFSPRVKSTFPKNKIKNKK
jgi:hypothetical protein